MVDRKRILIFSGSYGAGHNSSAEALERYFLAHAADSVEVKVIDFFERFAPSLNVLAKFAYQQSVQFFPELYGTFFDLTNKLPGNPVVQDLAQVGYNNAADFIGAWRPHAVVSTFPIAGGVVADIKSSRPVVAATVITDYGAHRNWLHPGTDLFFVACKEMREDLVSQGVPWDRVVVSGIPIHEKFSSELDPAECRREFDLADRFTVLLTMSAGSVGDLKQVVVQLVDSGIQVAAATGRSERLRRRLHTLEKKNPLLRGYGHVKDMHKLMAACDVLVGKAGGLTVSEALAMGLPQVIFNPVPGQEIYNVDFLVNYGAGLLARDEDDVVEKVRFLSTHPQRLEQMSGNAASLGKPSAAQAVCERVLAAIR